jgi:hypothetical protein
MKRINFIILATILISCAPQDEKKLGILGTWNLKHFLCYIGLPATVEATAKYTPNDVSNFIRINVNGREINYNASGTAASPASTTNNGTYQIATRSSVDSGEVTYNVLAPFNVVTLSLNARNPDDPTPGGTNISAVVTVDPAYFSNRFFQNLGTQLALELPIAFTGGTGEGFCNGACTSCVGIFDQI